MSKTFGQWDKPRLRLWLSLFFISLAVPTAFLIYQAYSQLKWEAFHHQQTLASELSSRIDNGLVALIADLESRSFSDFSFLIGSGDTSTSLARPSPLAGFPVDDRTPGLLGYFQIDSDGRFSTPLVPGSGTDIGKYGITAEELRKREQAGSDLLNILAQNRLAEVDSELEEEVLQQPLSPEETLKKRFAASTSRSIEEEQRYRDDAKIGAQAAFDLLSRTPKESGRAKKQEALTDAPQDYASGLSAERAETRTTESGVSGVRKPSAVSAPVTAAEPVVANETPGGLGGLADKDILLDEHDVARELHLNLFDNEVDPFELSTLESGHFVLFRKVWRDGQRYIQGALADQQQLLKQMIGGPLGQSVLATSTDLAVSWKGKTLTVFGNQSSRDYLSYSRELEGTPLYVTRLSSPLDEIELRYNIVDLPPAPGTVIVVWLSVLLALLLMGGFLMMYRLGLSQIALTRQQQDFVSAVSHELKTPLTSIRMYGEILQSGWASEEKKKNYYAYIHDESERLSRLIANVLQLARMTRNDLHLELRTISIQELMDHLSSKVVSQVESAGFSMNINCAKEVSDKSIRVDLDAFSQIIINLVDNAIKFSGETDNKQIDMECIRHKQDKLRISVRDYGPGVAPNQMRKIFKLFYRSENELTRETVGTGIGLALVKQLAQMMDGSIDVINRKPGAEFFLVFPIREDTDGNQSL